MRIINAQLLVASEKVRVRSPENPSVWVDIDRLSRMVFHYTDYPPKARPGDHVLRSQLQPPPAACRGSMGLAHAFRRFVVPVQSQPLERRLPQLAVDAEQEAGARWGRPASFDQASRPRPPDEAVGFTAEWIDTTRVFKGVETHREYSRVSLAKKPSTALSHEQEVGTKSNVKRGWRSSQRQTLGCCRG